MKLIFWPLALCLLAASFWDFRVNANTDDVQCAAVLNWQVYFMDESLGTGGITELTYAIESTCDGVKDVRFSETLPDGLEFTGDLGTDCQADVTVQGSLLQFSKGFLDTGLCFVHAKVLATAPNNYTTGSSRLEWDGGSRAGVSTVLTVYQNVVTVSKTFSPTSMEAGQLSEVGISVVNTDAASYNISVVDNLPPYLLAIPDTVRSSCGGDLFFDENQVAMYVALGASSSCTLQFSVTTAAAGTYINYATLSSGPSQKTTASAGLTVKQSTAIPPIFSKQFQPSTTAVGTLTSLEYSIYNADEVGVVLSIRFDDPLPKSMIIQGVSKSTCGGNLATEGEVVSLSEADLAPLQSCTIVILVSVEEEGAHISPQVTLTYDGGESTAAEAQVTATLDIPSLTKAFQELTVAVGSRTRLTLTVDPPESVGDGTTYLVRDKLPVGMSLATPPNEAIASDCTSTPGLVTTSGVTPGSAEFSWQITFGDQTDKACSLSLDVLISSLGALENTATLQYNDGLVSAGAVVAGVVPSIVRMEVESKYVTPSGTALINLAIVNENRENEMTEIAFSLDLDKALPGLIASELPSQPCGSESVLSGTALVSFSAGSLGPSGDCSFKLQVLVPADAKGSYTLTTSPVVATVGQTAVESPAATADLFVSNYLPVLSFWFSPSSVAAGDTTAWSFNIKNTHPSEVISNVQFTVPLCDVGCDSTLESDVLNPCGDGSKLELSATDQGYYIQFYDGVIQPDTTCEFSANLITSSKQSSLKLNPVVNNLMGTLEGEDAWGPPAESVLELINSPRLRKTLLTTNPSPDSYITLRYTLSLAPESTQAAYQIHFEEDLAGMFNGLEADSSRLPPGFCGSGQAQGSSLVSFDVPTMAPSESCTFDIYIYIPSDFPVGAVVSSQAGSLTAKMGSVQTSWETPTWSLFITGLTFTSIILDENLVMEPGASFEVQYDIRRYPMDEASYSSLTFSDDFNDFGIAGLALSYFPTSPCGGGISNEGIAITVTDISLPVNTTACTFSVMLNLPSDVDEGEYSARPSDLTGQGLSQPVSSNLRTFIVARGAEDQDDFALAE